MNGAETTQPLLTADMLHTAFVGLIGNIGNIVAAVAVLGFVMLVGQVALRRR